MSANVGFQSSYAWRSILGAKDLVSQGGKWVIGNGRKTKIWKDNWLGDNSMVWSRLPANVLGVDALVSELIDPDRYKITQWFDSRGATKIISTALSVRLPEDKFSWKWEKNDHYSVKTAYHSLCEANSRSWPSSSSTKDEQVWKEVWRARIPNKIKKFLLRLTKSIIPTRSNLNKKGIVLDPICPSCHSSVETHEQSSLCSWSVQ